MSTTSISSCGDCDYYPYSYVLEDGYERHLQSCQGPFYNTMRQPLVYYAEVQPCGRRSAKGRRKEAKNCFAKAFRWYTQEREPECCHHVSPELSGFATWLDAKYGEYLRENNGQAYCAAQRPPSTNDTGSRAPYAPCQPNEPTTTKRYSRMRSPWRKFRCHNKNAGDVPCRTPNGSCQFILQPKDLTRPASECYYQTPATCPNKSNTTVISTELEGVKRTIVKSQSLTSVCHEKINANCIDVITTQEGPKVKQVDSQKVRVVAQMPPKSPCDQSCKVKQEGKSVTKIQSATVKVQKTSKPCDTNRCKEVCKPVGEMRPPAKQQKNIVPCDPNCNQERKQSPAKIQKNDIRCDPNCCKEGCKPLPETRTSSKSHNKEAPYDPSCCNPECPPVEKNRMPVPQKTAIPYDPKPSYPKYEECKPVPETWTASKSQNKEAPNNPSCCNPECPPVEKNRMPEQPQKTAIPYDPKLCYPRYEHVQEIQGTVQARNIDVPNDPICCNTERKQPEEIRVQVQAQNIDIAADCCRQECIPTGDTQRSFMQSQIKNIPCDPTCIYKQINKPTGVTRNMNQAQNINQPQNITTPCEPTCYRPEYKPVGEIHQNYTKSQIRDASCDPNCIYNQTYTPAGVIRNNAEQSRNTTNPCEPTCYKPEHKLPSFIQRVFTRSQIRDNHREPPCNYKQEYKPAGEIRPPAREQSVTIPHEPSCMAQTKKPAADASCDPKCMYMQSAIPRVPINVQNIEQSYDTTCSYRQDSKTTRDIRTPTKSQSKQISCECDPNSYKFAADCSCKQRPLPQIQRSTSKSQKSETTCMCYPIRSASKVKTVPSKPQMVDHECQCPEDETLPVDAQVQCESSRQTFTSTSTNSTLCKCIIEKSIPIPPQKSPCKPMQPAPKPTPRHFIPFTSPKKTQKPAMSAEVSCQCPKDDIIKFDAPSQYDRSHFDTSCECVCPSVKPEKPRLVCNAQRPDSRTTTNYSSVAVRQVTRSHTFRNDAAQTSDHSICLEDFGHDYAFFMKIVCADKLNNDCYCDD